MREAVKVASCFGIMFSFAVSSTATNICIIDPVSVSQVRGNVVYVAESGGPESTANGVSVQLWRMDSKAQRVLVSETSTDLNGYFVIPKVASGSYEMILASAVAQVGFSVHVQGPTIFSWFPKNALRIGLGLVQPQGCPPSYVQAMRRFDPKKPPNPPLQPTAEKRGG